MFPLTSLIVSSGALSVTCGGSSTYSGLRLNVTLDAKVDCAAVSKHSTLQV